MLMDGQESVVGQSEALAYSRPTPVDTFIRTLYTKVSTHEYATVVRSDTAAVRYTHVRCWSSYYVLPLYVLCAAVHEYVLPKLKYP